MRDGTIMARARMQAKECDKHQCKFRADRLILRHSIHVPEKGPTAKRLRMTARRSLGSSFDHLQSQSRVGFAHHQRRR